MANFARVKLKKHPFTESVIPVKGYELLKKKYTLIGFENGDGGELTEVQKIMAEKIASKKKDVEAAEAGNEITSETEVSENAESNTKGTDDQELNSLREQYKEKFGKPANKNMKAETLKAKINEA